MQRSFGINRFSPSGTRLHADCNQRGFTLIELLVVLLIILILTAVTVASFNYSIGADRVRSAARQMQSFLAGARDKAIYAKEIRGVRLLLDPNDNHSVNAVQYIGSPQRETGMLQMPQGDASGLVVNYVSGTPWSGTYPPPPATPLPTLYSIGLLQPGVRIQIPANTGTWYTVSAVGSNNNLALNRPCTDLAGSYPATYSFVLELPPSVLADTQPVLLPRGVVIDLDGSNVPSSWRPNSFAGSYSTQMDILFTPRGTVVGGCLGLGMLHLHFAELYDVTNWKTIAGRSATNYVYATNLSSFPVVPADNPASTTPVVKRDRILVTLATQTGNASVHYVNAATPVGSVIATDPFSFAELGKVANK